MHKLTLRTYVIIKDWIKNDQKFSLCIPTGNKDSPSCLNDFQRNFVPSYPNSMTN